MRGPDCHAPPRWAALLLVLLLAGGCSYFHRGKAGDRPSYHELSPSVAYEMIRDNPGMLVLDLRPPQEFDGPTGHLRGATNVPLERLPYRLLELASYRQETFLIYCRTGDDCGQKGMEVLLSSGFEFAILMDGGIDGWIRSGFRTVLPRAIAGRGAPPGGAMRPLTPAETQQPSDEVDIPRVPPPYPD